MKDPQRDVARARARYTLMHIGIVAVVFSLAVLGSSIVPLDPGWRGAYGLFSTVVVLFVFFASRAWAADRLRGKLQAPDSQDGGGSRGE